MQTQQQGASLIEAEVTEAFRELVDASLALDGVRYFDHIDKEKFTGLSAEGKAWHSADELEVLITAGFRLIAEIQSLEFFNVKVTVINPTTAILVNEYKQRLLLKDQTVVTQAGGGTQVWSKSGQVWKLVSISASDATHRGDAVF